MEDKNRNKDTGGKAGGTRQDKLLDGQMQIETIQAMIDEAQAVIFDIGNVLIDFAWED